MTLSFNKQTHVHLRMKLFSAFIDVPALFITRGESHSFSMNCGGKCNYDAATCITDL
jgi:hypothetical protein